MDLSIGLRGYLSLVNPLFYITWNHVQLLELMQLTGVETKREPLVFVRRSHDAAVFVKETSPKLTFPFQKTIGTVLGQGGSCNDDYAAIIDLHEKNGWHIEIHGGLG